MTRRFRSVDELCEVLDRLNAEVARLTEKVAAADKADEIWAALPPVYTSMGVGFDKARQALRIAMEALDEEEGFREDAGGTGGAAGTHILDDESSDYILSDDLEEAERIAARVEAEEDNNSKKDVYAFYVAGSRLAKYWGHVNDLKAREQ